MLVKDVGEFHLIELLAEKLRTHPVHARKERGFSLRVPIGDDAAAWDETGGTRVLTTDTLVEGVHFRLEHTSWADLGWKAMAVNLSDLAAMGCRPVYSVVTLGLTGQLPVDGIIEMYRGMMEAAGVYGGAVVGGDVVRAKELLVTVAMYGAALTDGGLTAERPLLTRGAAQPGQQIAVTGTLGCAAGGLRMLERGMTFDQATSAHLKAAHNRPAPRIAEGTELVRRGVTTAMDISDGMLGDLGKLCEASGVGAVVRSDLVPVDEHLRHAFADDWLLLAVSGGEDYELLFAAPGNVLDDVAQGLEVPVTVIGETVAEPRRVSLVDSRGQPVQVGASGWDHFPASS